MLCFALQLIILSLMVSCHCARILFVAPTPSYSHQIIYQPIWRELALRGHDMVVITPDPIRDPSIKTLKEIDVSFAYDAWKGNIKEWANIQQAKPNSNVPLMVSRFLDVMEMELKHPEVDALIKNKTEHFDVAMVEFMAPVMFAFKERFKCPFVGISSIEIAGRMHEYMGNPAHMVAYPDPMTSFEEELTFFDRFTCLWHAILSEIYWRNVFMPRNDAIIQKYFGNGYPTVEELYRSVDLVIINANPLLYQVRPVSPATIIITGGIHIKEEKPLPKELQHFLNNSKTGVVYFSLGSNLNSIDMPAHVRNTIIQVFSKLPYDVLLKYEEDLPEKPKNVKIMKWLPQQDILRHPKIKLFITQGGKQSVEEALFSNVPMLVIPFIADQIFNAKRVLAKGLGLVMENRITMEAGDLKNKILEVINNPKYKRNLRELATLVKDEPMSALEKAVWWTEYVIRHKGAQHLKAKTIPFYQFYYLDVLCFIFFVMLIALFIFYKLAMVCACRRKIKKE